MKVSEFIALRRKLEIDRIQMAVLLNIPLNRLMRMEFGGATREVPGFMQYAIEGLDWKWRYSSREDWYSWVNSNVESNLQKEPIDVLFK